MTRLIYEAIDKIDIVTGAILSLLSALIGSSIGKTNILATTLASTDPDWFIQISPILQTAAWIGALVVAFFTTVKLYRDLRAKKRLRKQNEDKS